MKNIFSRIWSYALAHKIISTVVIIIVLGGGYYTYKKVHGSSVPTTYVLGTVQKGTLITTVTGTGQVSASTQLDVKPKVSGDIISIDVAPGQSVTAGTAIAHLDATDALKAVRNAQADLQGAKLSLEKTSIQSEGDLTTAEQSADKTKQDLTTAYENALNNVSASFADLSTIVSGLNDILNGPQHSSYMASDQIQLSGGQVALDYKNAALKAYNKLNTDYQATLPLFTSASQANSSQASLDTLLSSTHQVLQDTADTIKDTATTANFVSNNLRPSVPAQLNTDVSALSSDLSKINGHISDVAGNQSSILTAKQSASQATDVLSRTTSVQNGQDTSGSLDLQTAELALTQKENALSDAETTLGEYTVTAPFDGVVAALPLIKGDSASSGSAIATLTTTSQIAEISLNEVDVAKINVGDNVTLTFDAIPDLTIAGQVAEIDLLGTVTQGVVTYDVKISFDSQDQRIKSGMSVSASIIADSKSDVLLVPSSAVKTTGGASTVQVVSNPPTAGAGAAVGVTLPTPPQTVVVQTGDSNDTQTEITSGLNEGQTIVTRTVTGSSATTASTATTQRTGGGLFGGGGGGGGAAARIPR